MHEDIKSGERENKNYPRCVQDSRQCNIGSETYASTVITSAWIQYVSTKNYLIINIRSKCSHPSPPPPKKKEKKKASLSRWQKWTHELHNAFLSRSIHKLSSPVFSPWRQIKFGDVNMKRGKRSAQRGNELVKQVLVMVSKKSHLIKSTWNQPNGTFNRKQLLRIMFFSKHMRWLAFPETSGLIV